MVGLSAIGVFGMSHLSNSKTSDWNAGKRIKEIIIILVVGMTSPACVVKECHHHQDRGEHAPHR